MTLEKLLNILIKKGWHLFGWDDKLSSLHKEFGVGKWYIRFHNGMDSELFDLRQLTSKESGLWQFCCENGMIRITESNSLCNWLFGEEIYYDETHTEKLYKNDNYQYWLIECALKDEDELDKFLLENIKIS